VFNYIIGYIKVEIPFNVFAKFAPFIEISQAYIKIYAYALDTPHPVCLEISYE
jgi:hypothetical protein